MSADRPPALDWYNLIVSTAAVKGWSIADVASQSGVARSTVYGWEKNPGRPQAKAVNAVADALGINRERALRLAGVIGTPEAPADPEMPTPEEAEALRAHVRKVLGPDSPMEEALDRVLSGEPPTSGGQRGPGKGGASGRSGSSGFQQERRRMP